MIAKVFAATQNLTDLYLPANKLGNNVQISTIVSPLVSNILIASGIFAFFTIIFAGFQYITSGGDKGKVSQAQNMLNYGILGLVLVVSAYLITRVIGSIIGFELVK